ncbi:MAG: hypothetical protein Q4E13_15400 [Clostridia bacterium]|nr:hypothetical protein [Clostridia bacterium]
MNWAIIGEGESPGELSARLRRPICVLLRANRLYSTAWLLPGRELFVPEADFCGRDVGPCPLRMVEISAERFAQGICPGMPERLQLWSRTHGGRILPEWAGQPDGAALTLRPFESVAGLAKRGGSDEATVRRWNRYYGGACPGVQLFVPGRESGAVRAHD